MDRFLSIMTAYENDICTQFKPPLPHYTLIIKRFASRRIMIAIMNASDVLLAPKFYNSTNSSTTQL
jgi:hypothetical protein